ncbi:hypothetical protein DFH08DRAFT_686859 [Mycena albidolilacea]|uniref:Uncharacterized protein n=1 Tax=Mycena albidolilacea TaxID=1033008 RepID=A0AAD7AGA8_9AGAR|nr:hypothetical protein DFH08DRAFT_686859 [Mycena albidolilacea]
MAAAAIGCEDLSELDSGTAPITPLSRIPPSSANNGARRSLSWGDPFQDPRPSAHQRRTKVAAAAGSIAARFKVRKVRIASTGWIGLQDHGILPDAATGECDPVGIVHSLETFFGPDAMKPGFTLVKAPKDAGNLCPIVDSEKCVCTVYGGIPDTPNFMRDVYDPAVEAMEIARAQASLSESRLYHRRGNWASHTTGATHGTGCDEPGDFVNGIINTAVILTLVSNAAFIDLAEFGSGLFSIWAPHLFQFYIDYMGSFYLKNPKLQRPFVNSIWSACTFNLGPRTCAFRHRDFANLAYGWCAITALGTFDYTKGGHLILWDCKLILEFPPGCTILIPSAAIFRSNTRIAEHETRYSFTQYTAGALFRWVERGFRSEKDYIATLTAEEIEEERKLGLERAAAGAALFSTLDELKAGWV